MSPLNFNQDPQIYTSIFTQYVKALVRFLLWGTIALASLAGTYVAIRGILIAVKIVLKALGV